MTWRTGLIFILVAGATALAYEFGARLSDDAVLMLVGVACGIIAGIPISLGLWVALTRERRRGHDEFGIVTPDQETLVVDEQGRWVAETFAGTMQSAPPRQLYPPYPQYVVYTPPSTALPPTYLPLLLPPYYPSSMPPPPIQERNFKIVGEEEEEVSPSDGN